MLLLFVPMTLTGTSGVAPADAGVAASLLNTGQQVGGAIGLAALGSVIWTVVADSIRRQTAQAVAAWHACLSAVRTHGHRPRAPATENGQQAGAFWCAPRRTHRRRAGDVTRNSRRDSRA